MYQCNGANVCQERSKGGNKKEIRTSRQNARHLSVAQGEKTPLSSQRKGSGSPEVRRRSYTTRAQTRRRHACHGQNMRTPRWPWSTPRQARVAGIPSATLAAYQHAHMCQRLLQGILLGRACPHGVDAMMQVLIEFRNAGIPIVCPEATPGSCVGTTDGLMVGESE